MISNKVKQIYASKIALLQTIDIENVKLTKKVPSEKIDLRMLAEICKVVKEYFVKPLLSMCEIFRTIYQCCREI
ncbi:hypothetical protein NUSPORA_01021 [Nucleospora cyclopteri]